MSVFNFAMGKNMVKLSLITVAALSSTLGLRTELIVILGDIFWSTWIAIGWVGVIIAVLSYYKAKQDVEIDELRFYRENRRMLLGASVGNTLDKPDNPVLANETK
jgi:hypothetical protein